VGLRGLASFQNAGVAVLRANANTVREVVAAYRRNELQELTEAVAKPGIIINFY
jgi:predicted Fe-Mo cluster-binding NifX family protein